MATSSPSAPAPTPLPIQEIFDINRNPNLHRIPTDEHFRDFRAHILKYKSGEKTEKQEEQKSIFLQNIEKKKETSTSPSTLPPPPPPTPIVPPEKQLRSILGKLTETNKEKMFEKFINLLDEMSDTFNEEISPESIESFIVIFCQFTIDCVFLNSLYHQLFQIIETKNRIIYNRILDRLFQLSKVPIECDCESEPERTKRRWIGTLKFMGLLMTEGLNVNSPIYEKNLNICDFLTQENNLEMLFSLISSISSVPIKKRFIQHYLLNININTIENAKLKFDITELLNKN